MRFAETDQMGVAHHSAYVVWLEAARVEWLRARGLSYREMEAGGVSLAVSGLELHYRASARFDDLLTVETTLTEARSRRFKYVYRILRGDTLLATATTLHTPTDRQGRAVRLPEKWFSPLVGLRRSEHADVQDQDAILDPTNDSSEQRCL